jgi:hypothetical protein
MTRRNTKGAESRSSARTVIRPRGAATVIGLSRSRTTRRAADPEAVHEQRRKLMTNWRPLVARSRTREIAAVELTLRPPGHSALKPATKQAGRRPPLTRLDRAALPVRYGAPAKLTVGVVTHARIIGSELVLDPRKDRR